MKKIAIFLLLGLVSLHLFAQTVIEKPEYGYATFPGEITKIEMLDTTTVLHFKLKKLPWGYYHIPIESYIKNVSGDNKLFVSDVTGATFKRNKFPSSGVATYQLYFPPLNKTVKTIDFGIDKERGWYMYDIVLKEDENSLLLPKALRGNWLLADGSNRWDYGFNSKYAIIEGTVWSYKSITKKGKLYTIRLENDSDVKTIYAKQVNNEQVAFGSATKTLNAYSLSRVINPKFSLKGDTEFKDVTFGLDSTTYSGKIKGFSDRMNQKTLMVYVNNAFRGEQESHLVKINADGTFQSKIPLTHPQTVFVRTKSAAYTIFLEPYKETFHYLDNNASYFMGDNAQLNSDLNALKKISFRLGKKERKVIGETSPEDYKKMCFKLKENALNKINAFQKDNYVIKKAVQLKKIDIMLDFYSGLMSYNMYRSSLQYQNKKAKKEEDKLPFKEFEVSNDYYDFLPDSILDNELLALSNSYYFFTNNIVHADIFNNYGYRNELSKVEKAYWLQKKDVELTTEELNMVENSKQIETPKRLAKLLKYKKAYGEIEQEFYKNYSSYFKDVNLALREKEIPSQNYYILNIAEYLKRKDIKITDEEATMVKALSVLDTPEEIEGQRVFREDFSNTIKSFNEKYKAHHSEIYKERANVNREEKISEFFGKDSSFLQDVIKMQLLSKQLESFIVYSDDELVAAKKTLKSTFMKNYLVEINEQTKAKIVDNKTKRGYTVHNVEKSEGDELFASMLEKFKGKVVYVDFWATWCGPCKSGIKRIAPLKEEMANEDVVFLYVTNQTSPEGTWKNAIANIKGEHYRVSADEWNYLSQKFNISGIPHYTLVDRKGNVVKPKLRHMDNTILKRILKAEIEK